MQCIVERVSRILRTIGLSFFSLFSLLCTKTDMDTEHSISAVHKMCTKPYPNNWCHDFYRLYGDTVQSYLQIIILPRLRDPIQRGGTALLTEMQCHWSEHKEKSSRLRKVFVYLDRYYTQNARCVLPLEQFAHYHFKIHIYDEVKSAVTSAVIYSINEGRRSGEIIGRDVLSAIVEMYETVGIGMFDFYTADLETPVVESSRQYFSELLQGWVDDGIVSASTFLTNAERARKEELAVITGHLSEASKPRLVQLDDENRVLVRRSFVTYYFGVCKGLPEDAVKVIHAFIE